MNLGLSSTAGFLSHHVLGHDVGGREQLRLARREGRGGGRIVVVALDLGVGRGLRQQEILGGAARDRDGLVGELLGLGDSDAVGPEDADRQAPHRAT